MQNQYAIMCSGYFKRDWFKTQFRKIDKKFKLPKGYLIHECKTGIYSCGWQG